MNNETIEIKEENVMAAYKEAVKNGKTELVTMLEQVFGKETFKPQDVTERIKTFEDAMDELGSEHPLVLEYKAIISRCGGLSSDLLAYMKLRIIAAALNEGWKPQFTEDEWRYFPWFLLYAQKEIDEMDEEEKSRVVYRSANNANAVAGLAYAHANYASSFSYTHVGGRLAFKSNELAKYVGHSLLRFGRIMCLKRSEVCIR